MNIKRDARRVRDSYGKCGMRKVVAAILGVNIRITTHNHVRSRDNIHVELLKMNKNIYVIKAKIICFIFILLTNLLKNLYVIFYVYTDSKL